MADKHVSRYRRTRNQVASTYVTPKYICRTKMFLSRILSVGYILYTGKTSTMISKSGGRLHGYCTKHAEQIYLKAALLYRYIHLVADEP